MTDLEKNRDRLNLLFNNQYFMVLATQFKGELHTSLVSFVNSNDLHWFYFLTPRNSRKFQNLKKNPHVSLFIDNRSNKPQDIRDAVGVTVVGKAEEVPENELPELLNFFLQKHKYLNNFANSRESCLVRVRVKHYRLVTRFQEVTDLSIED